MPEPILSRSSTECGSCGNIIRAVTFLYPDYILKIADCQTCDVISMKDLTKEIGSSS